MFCLGQETQSGCHIHRTYFRWFNSKNIVTIHRAYTFSSALTHSVAATRTKLFNKQPIISLQPGESIYVDIRTWGEQWYQSIGLPDMSTTRYVDKWEITGWKREPFSLYGRSALDGKYYVLNHAGVLNWGRWKEVVEGMIVLTHEMLDLYPLLRQ